MAFIDYYEVLGIEKSATVKEIKAAYKKLARQFHPDLNHDYTEVPQKFQTINEAYSVLIDPAKKRLYDLYGEFWKIAEGMEQNKKQFSRDDLSQTIGRRGFFKKFWS